MESITIDLTEEQFEYLDERVERDAVATSRSDMLRIMLLDSERLKTEKRRNRRLRDRLQRFNLFSS
jgi:Arc/MetJ-type ribon-helix-helix transcriptional regulator